MFMEVMNVTVHQQNIDKAFALAHRASEDENFPHAARNMFRAVACQIWLACGADRPTEQVKQAIEAERQGGN
jgi:hypothetical protein